jgi:hypothetical protein
LRGRGASSPPPLANHASAHTTKPSRTGAKA